MKTSEIIITLFRRAFAYVLSLLAFLNLSPNKPASPDGNGDAFAACVFSSEQDYRNYYFYCMQEAPELYTWSPEALAARKTWRR